MIQKALKGQHGFGMVAVLVVVLAVVLVGGAGAYVWHKHDTKQAADTAKTKTVASTKGPSKTTTTTPANPYAGWKTYTSPYEKLSFKYPATWTGVATNASVTAQTTNADAFQMTSPSGSVAVSWFSAVTGLGGACSTTVLPGTTVGPGDLSPCSYLYVLDKQKLTGADLYFVEGVVEAGDASHYSPFCGLQGPNGILTSQSNIGYMIFQAKNDGQQAGLMCSKVPGNLGGVEPMTGTRAQATAFLSTPEMQQAKLILLSASY